MSSVDDRIVAMKFDNKQFKPGVESTLSMLDKLKQSLNFSASKKSVQDLQATADGFSMGGMGSSVGGVSAKFLALSTVAITALTRITNKAIDTGIAVTKSLTIAPVMDGFAEYELKMGSIQTILSNTSRHGTTLEEVTANLDELNLYADKTIYNFGDMTKNIGLFTNAGIKIEDATSMIKGFSNEAAASGTTAQGAAGAAYQLSQALSAGTIRLMDWRSLTNVGMGNKNMQNGLIEIADAMGALSEAGTDANTVQSDFNASLEKKWLSADIMSTYLRIMAGDIDEAQMKQLGLNEAQIKTFMDQQRMSEDAATKVRTWSQLVDTLQEGVGSSWSETFDIILGDFNQATVLFTGISQYLEGAIGKFGEARNKLLGRWAELGGRDIAIGGLVNVVRALEQVIKPIGEAFRSIFPRTTGRQLLELTIAFHRFTEGLKISDETARNIRKTFKGVFAVFSIAWQIIKGVAGVIFDLIGVILGGTGSFLEFTGSIGDWLVSVDKALKKGDRLANFFDKLSDYIQAPIKFLGELIGVIFGFASSVDVSGIDSVTNRLEPFASMGDRLKGIWSGLIPVFEAIGDALAPIAQVMGEALRDLGSGIADALGSGDFSNILDILNTGLFAAILFAVKKFLLDFEGLNVDFGGGMLNSMKGSFDQLTNSLSAMQSSLQAKALLNIAMAVALLVASIVALSLIDSAKLTKALTAIGAAFTQLLAAMAILVKISGSAGFVTVPLIAASMVLLSSSLLILTGAIALMGQLEWETIGRGLAGIAGALAVIGVAMALMPTGMVLQAAALVLIGAALNVIGLAIAGLGLLPWENIGKGLVAIAGALIIIAGAIALMPITAIAQAFALTTIAKAIVIIGAAVGAMSLMSWEQIAKGLVMLAGALAIIAAGLYLMTAALPGAAALVIAAGALAILAPVLVTLGSMEWENIKKGLLAIAGVFVTIGLSSILLLPLIPVIFGLGLAFVALGAGLMLIAGAAFVFATAFTMITAVSTAGSAALVALLTSLVAMIPWAMEQIAVGIINMAKVITDGAPELTQAFTAVLISLLDAIIQITPKLLEALNVLLAALAVLIITNIPLIAKAGYKLVIGLMEEMREHIPKIVEIGSDLIIRFLKAIAKHHKDIADAAFNTIIEFIENLSETIDNNSERLGEAGGKLAWSIVSGMQRGLGAGIKQVMGSAGQMATGAITGAMETLGINSPSKEFEKLGAGSDEGMALGIDNNANVVTRAAARLGSMTIDEMRNAVKNVSDILSGDVDMDPVIRPILDLSSITREAERIDSLFNQNPIAGQVSFDQASDISAIREIEAEMAASQPATTEEKTIIFEQHNTSPKALSEVDIYMNTRNQLSLAKEALDL